MNTIVAVELRMRSRFLPTKAEETFCFSSSECTTWTRQGWLLNEDGARSETASEESMSGSRLEEFGTKLEEWCRARIVSEVDIDGGSGGRNVAAEMGVVSVFAEAIMMIMSDKEKDSVMIMFCADKNVSKG